MTQDWSDWSQATIALNTENNGTLYDLAQCSDGFRYKYKGNGHRFTLEFENSAGKAVTYLNDNSLNNSTSEWTTVTVNNFNRDPYDEAPGTAFDLDYSKIKGIRWTVRPSDKSAITGYLQIKDFYCLGILDIDEVEPNPNATKIANPTVTNTNLVYDGTPKSAGIAQNALYTITGGEATNAGTYTATVALKDKPNREWTDVTSTAKATGKQPLEHTQ
ncbi:hypothetical protein R83H12_00280 [Fibrobacteria bacterium R8-3-H12]